MTEGELAVAPPGRSAVERGWRPGRMSLVEAALVLALAVATVLVLRWQALEQNFTVDESRWIATSRYFWITFIDRDLFGEAWQPSYVVMTHPPVARYAIGLGLWLQGWTPDELNGRYDTDRSRAFNRRAGNIPTRELLDAARRVVLVFAVGSTLLLYPIGRALAGPVGGASAVLVTLANPLLPALWTRALAESVLAFFCLLAFLLVIQLARISSRNSTSFWLPVGLGLSLGLAAATKLSGILVGLGLGLYVLLVQANQWRARRRWPGLGPWLDVALAAILIFIFVNPLLYPNPAVRTAFLFEHRRDEMEYQAAETPRLAVAPDLGVRSELMFRRTFLDNGTFQTWLGWPLDVPLFLIGLGVACLATWRALRRHDVLGPPTWLLCWTLATFVISTVNLGFDSAHYVALPVALAVLLESLALAFLVDLALRYLRSGGALASRLW
jgi:hypothetical protein